MIRYLLDDDDDLDEDDDIDEDDDDEDEEDDEDDEEVETWQVGILGDTAKGRGLLDFACPSCLDWPRFSSSSDAG
jgi:hypothetical protein